MPQDYAASVQGVSLRVTRLDASGNLLNGETDSYTTTAFIRVSFTPEYEEGDEITEKAADGTVCISYKAPDTLKRVNMEIAVCEPDPELSNLLSGGLLLSDTDANGNEISSGWASAQVGEDPSGNGVAVEVWSRAIQSGKAAASNPYFHWIFPLVKTRLTGDRVIENGLLATTFEGFGLGNINFRNGPDNGWKWPAATDRPYMYARASWAPQGLKGFYQWVPPVTAGGPPTSTAGPASFVTPVGVNVLNSVNPYPYNDAVEVDYVLSSDDYLPDATGVATYPASAASQTVKNAPPATGVVQNPVTYLSRGDTVAPPVVTDAAPTLTIAPDPIDVTVGGPPVAFTDTIANTTGGPNTASGKISIAGLTAADITSLTLGGVPVTVSDVGGAAEGTSGSYSITTTFNQVDAWEIAVAATAPVGSYTVTFSLTDTTSSTVLGTQSAQLAVA